MTVKELKQKIANVSDDTIVTISNYDDDSEEAFKFEPADGAEMVKPQGQKEEVLSIFINY